MTTLKKIAELSGTSVNAVSRVLKGQNKENRPTAIARAKRIRQLAQELGYRPNTAAQAMKKGEFKCVMLLQSATSSFGKLHESDIIDIQQSLSSHGYKLMLTILPEYLYSEDDAPAFFKESCVDGVLISINRDIPPWLGENLDKLHIPKVWIGSDQTSECVCHDDFQSASRAVEKLIALGHKKIVYADITSPMDDRHMWHFSTTQRLDGYVHAMKKASLKPITVRPESHICCHESVDYVWKNIMEKHKPTAIIPYGMYLTGRSILYACARHNIQIPKDLSMITWEEKGFVENGIELTAITASQQGVGKTAAKMIYDLMKTPGKKIKPAILPFEFHEGASIAPPKKKQ